MLKITFSGDEITNFCRVDPGNDSFLIEGLKEAAIIEAREYLNTDFSVDGVEVEAPETVKLWVLNRVAQLNENRGLGVKPDYTLLKPHRVYPFRG